MAQFLKHCTLPSSQERSLNSESMFPISKTMFSERTVARRQDTRRSCANSRFEAEIFSSIMSHGRSAEVARKDCEHNIDGYHVRNYQPGRIPALSSFLGELTDLPILVLEGCARWPRLRICHGCHDVFKYNVAPQIFLSSQNSALLTCSFAADHSGLSFRATLLPSNLSASTKSF
jgi:hypothetical protein